MSLSRRRIYQTGELRLEIQALARRVLARQQKAADGRYGRHFRAINPNKSGPAFLLPHRHGTRASSHASLFLLAGIRQSI